MKYPRLSIPQRRGGQNRVSAGQRPGATQSRHSLVPKERELTPELQLNLRRILYPGVILKKGHHGLLVRDLFD